MQSFFYLRTAASVQSFIRMLSTFYRNNVYDSNFNIVSIFYNSDKVLPYQIITILTRYITVRTRSSYRNSKITVKTWWYIPCHISANGEFPYQSNHILLKLPLNCSTKSIWAQSKWFWSKCCLHKYLVVSPWSVLANFLQPVEDIEYFEDFFTIVFIR